MKRSNTEAYFYLLQRCFVSHRIHGAGIYANIGGILLVNVTIYSIHGSSGYWEQGIRTSYMLGDLWVDGTYCRLVVSSNQWGFYQQKEWIWHWWMAMEGSCKYCHTWGNILSIAIPLQNRLCCTRMATSRLAIHSFIKFMRWYSLRQMLLVISTSFHFPKCDVINVIIKQTAHPRTNLGKL